MTFPLLNHWCIELHSQPICMAHCDFNLFFYLGLGSFGFKCLPSRKYCTVLGDVYEGLYENFQAKVYYTILWLPECVYMCEVVLSQAMCDISGFTLSSPFIPDNPRLSVGTGPLSCAVP